MQENCAIYPRIVFRDVLCTHSERMKMNLMTKDNVFTLLVKAKEDSISDVKEVKEIVLKKNRSEISIGKVSNGHSFENDRNAI